MPDPVEQYLRELPTSDRVRAFAFDAVYNMDEAAAEMALRELPVPDEIRAALWDFRQTGAFPLPSGASEGMIAPSTPEGDPGYWEDKGIAGQEWHAPTGSGSDVTRPDNSLLGMPPELVVTAPIASVKAVIGGGGMIGGAKAALAATAPAIKYEATKTGLEGMGVPPSVATAIALGVSGYSRQARPRTVPRATPKPKPAASASPVASPPAAPASPTAPSAPASAPRSIAGSGWSPQRIRNEVGLAARRTKTTLSDEQYAQAEQLVKSGTAPAEAVQKVAGGKAAAAAPGAPLAKPKLNAAEMAEYTRLRRMGKSHEQAVAAIAEQQALAARLGTPGSESVRSRVAERNATGRWPKQ